jgi:uncharacterized membrane protein YiaA
MTNAHSVPLENIPVPARHADRWRTWLSNLALLCMCVVMVAAIAVTWVEVMIQDTNRYVETVAPLASNADVEDAVTTAIMDQLAGIDLTSALQEAFPSASGKQIASLARAIHAYTESIVKWVVASDQFATLWTEANRAIHTVVSGLLTGEESALASAEDAIVSIDLTRVLAAVADQLELNGITYFDGVLVNGTSAELALFDASKLHSAQEVIRLLHRIAWLLPLLAIAMLLLAIAVAPYRIAALRRAGVAIAVTMAALLVALALVRDWQADQVAVSDRPVALAFFDTMVVRLRDSLRSLLMLGTLLALAVTFLHRGTWRLLTDWMRRRVPTIVRRLDIVFFGISVLAMLALGANGGENAWWLGLAAVAGVAGFIVQRTRSKRELGSEAY